MQILFKERRAIHLRRKSYGHPHKWPSRRSSRETAQQTEAFCIKVVDVFHEGQWGKLWDMASSLPHGSHVWAHARAEIQRTGQLKQRQGFSTGGIENNFEMGIVYPLSGKKEEEEWLRRWDHNAWRAQYTCRVDWNSGNKSYYRMINRRIG